MMNEAVSLAIKRRSKICKKDLAAAIQKVKIMDDTNRWAILCTLCRNCLAEKFKQKAKKKEAITNQLAAKARARRILYDGYMLTYGDAGDADSQRWGWRW